MKKSKKRKKKPASIDMMKKSLLKSAAVLLLLAINWLGLSAVPGTLAFYNDQEQSAMNFTAGTLDVSLGSPADFSPAVTPATTTVKNIHFSNDGNLDSLYNFDLADISGDQNLCDKLLLVVKLGSQEIYSGPLLDFAATSTLPGMTAAALDWEASLSDSDAALKNKTCNFDLDIFGWETYAPDSSQSFTDSETISNTVVSGDWQDAPPAPGPGDVVINELMWMGSRNDGDSSDADDEWIELKNMTSHDIDLSNWNINNAGQGGGAGAHLEIPHGYTIKANGYFLIAKKKWDETLISLTADLPPDRGLSHKSGMSLLNGGEQLILKDKDGNIIDLAGLDDTAWPAGSNGAVKKSMERNDSPGDGGSAANWHTCEPSGMTPEELVLMKTYWDSDAQNNNCGTPLHGNLSFEPIKGSGLGAAEPPIISGLSAGLNPEETAATGKAAGSSADAGENSGSPAEEGNAAAPVAETPPAEENPAGGESRDPVEPVDIPGAPEDIAVPPPAVNEQVPAIESEATADAAPPQPAEAAPGPDPVPPSPAEAPAA